MANTSKSRTSRRSSARRRTGSRNTTSRSTRRPSARSSARRASAARRSGSASRSTASRTRRTSSASRSRSTRSSASRKTSSSSSKSYTSVKQQLDQQINSLRQLKSQAEGKASQGRPSPATISRFANVVNNGGVIRKASTAAIQRTAGNRQCRTASAAFKALKSKYGATIKAVSPAKNGGWLIAASSTWKGKPFKFGQ